jgi:hypothetical protein
LVCTTALKKVLASLGVLVHSTVKPGFYRWNLEHCSSTLLSRAEKGKREEKKKRAASLQPASAVFLAEKSDRMITVVDVSGLVDRLNRRVWS